MDAATAEKLANWGGRSLAITGLNAEDKERVTQLRSAKK